MAKKKTRQQSGQEKTFTPDLEMLTHKYSDFYDGFMLYDQRLISYPIYKTKISHLATLVQKLHPVILEILRIIDYLQTIKTDDSRKMLVQITQMDEDILNGILSEFDTKGYLKQTMGLELTTNGKEALQKDEEKITEELTAYIAFDGVFGTILGVATTQKDMLLDQRADKNSIEFKPHFGARPRTEHLNDEFEGEKTLRQVITEGLKSQTGNKYDTNEILSVEPRKFFKKYFCLFYKNAEEEERILVINSKYEEDIEATELFDRLMNEGKFTDSVNQESKELMEENYHNFEEATPEVIKQKLEVDLTNGKTIETLDHKKYFKYVLNNAKKEICIQSPWIRKNILEYYENEIKGAIERGVKITVKYGMKSRNRFDKVGIDDGSLKFFDGLDKKFFKLIKDNDHSKIIICDTDFMIIGSFNWLSFGDNKDSKDKNEPRNETSTINTNKNEIMKQKEKFKK